VGGVECEQHGEEGVSEGEAVFWEDEDEEEHEEDASESAGSADDVEEDEGVQRVVCGRRVLCEPKSDGHGVTRPTGDGGGGPSCCMLVLDVGLMALSSLSSAS